MKSLLASSILLLLACSTSSTAEHGTAPHAKELAGQTREPFTSCSALHVGGQPVGYLVSYDPVPDHADVERTLPTGCYRIQDLTFAEVGFVTPNGEVRRHTVPGYSESLGAWDLDVGLAKFFGDRGPVEQVPISP